MSKYGVVSGPYFPVFSPNLGKYGLEITPYLETFYTVRFRPTACKFIKNDTLMRAFSCEFGKVLLQNSSGRMPLLKKFQNHWHSEFRILEQSVYLNKGQNLQLEFFAILFCNSQNV